MYAEEGYPTKETEKMSAGGVDEGQVASVVRVWNPSECQIANKLQGCGIASGAKSLVMRIELGVAMAGVGACSCKPQCPPCIDSPLCVLHRHRDLPSSVLRYPFSGELSAV